MPSITYAFLLDEKAMHLAPLFPNGRAKTVAELGMSGATDDEVLALAEREKRILVTSNRDDFLERYNKYAAQGGRKKCTDLYGLVLFNGERSAQERHFPISKIEKRLHLILERIHVTWRDVLDSNLLVRITSETIITQRLPRCPECMRLMN